jgi:hypothetical protein
MLRPDHEAPWLALITLVLAGLFAYLVVNPLPRWLPQPQMASRPVVRYEAPPIPAWPVPVPHAAHLGLSLAAVAG